MSGVDDIGGDIRHSGRPDDAAIAALAARRHGVVATWQLAHRLFDDQVCNRAADGGYTASTGASAPSAVARVSAKGRWPAAFLACGPDAGRFRLEAEPETGGGLETRADLLLGIRAIAEDSAMQFDNDFLAIVIVAACAAVTVATLPKQLAPPVVVVELVLGIIIGPNVLDIVRVTDFTGFFAELGLGMLFFFAGYELDFDRVRGKPLKLAALGWTLSLALAYTLGGALAAAGIVLSLIYTGSALATTAFGTLVPILGDAGELRTEFGTYLLAAGAMGELGPILVITLVLTTQDRIQQAGLLVAFIALSVVLALFSVRYVWRGWPVIERTLESSSQLAVRASVVVIFGLAVIAGDLGFDVLLGGFVAGMIIRSALRGQELEIFESKLTAVGFGFLIPFFFVTSGMRFDLAALGSASALAKLGLFVVLFLIVRGAPAILLYRGELGLGDRMALAFLSATALPLVVAITTLATADGHMRTSTAAALVGAGMLSTTVFPQIGLRVRRRTRRELAEDRATTQSETGPIAAGSED